MIFVAKGADFSAKNIKTVEIDFDAPDSGDSGSGTTSGTKVTMIEIDESITSVKIGTTATFTAEVFPANADDKTIVWSCSPTNYATINSSTGVLTPIKAGTVTVKAKATDGSNVMETVTVEIQAKTKEDISAITETILGYYGTHHTDEQAVALDDMIVNLGGNTEGSIWSKLDIVMLPCLANSINTAFVNAKTGKDQMEYSSSGKINATNNSIDWNTIYTVSDGCIKCLDDSNTKNTLNIPIYRFNTSVTGITGSKFSLITGGNIDDWAGGTGAMIPTTTSNKMYTNNNSTQRIGADYSSNCIKGLSINWVSETEGFENTVNAPANKVGATYGSQDVLNTFATANSGSAKQWNTYMRCKSQFYLMILSQYLTQSEMELTISEFDKLVKVFGVDQTV